jgi:cytosine/adenosine deaminase-related metal-dependent hydrolase
MSILLRGGTVITADTRGTILHNASLLVDHDRIVEILPEGISHESASSEIIDAREQVIIPGFIQTHVHLCQTLFRGLADDLQLLDWLQAKIFPYEAAHNERSMYLSAMLGIAELIRSGTTTILDMGSIHYEEEIIRALGENGLRAFVGKAMMDINDAYPRLSESTAEALRSTRLLAEQWHNSFDGRIKYAPAPRFVLSCTDALLMEVHAMLDSLGGILFHTHASENTLEIQAVRKRCNMENIEFLHHLRLLSERSCLAHCIHLTDTETDILKEIHANVTHCPSSNLKLGSGIANIPYLKSRGINISLGADGSPCNNSLDMFQEMRLASLIQKPIHGPASMPAREVFEMATVGGARALGLESDIGSIEVGKKADIVVLNFNTVGNPVTSDNLYSSIVYSGSPENVDSVMIDGRWAYRKKEFVGIEAQRLTVDARCELKKLLDRVEFI